MLLVGSENYVIITIRKLLHHGELGIHDGGKAKTEPANFHQSEATTLLHLHIGQSRQNSN